MDSFGDLKITRQFLNVLEEQGLTEPSPIQKKAIPPVLAGQDVIGVAPTGTGKTLAFVLPILQALKFHQTTGVRALILSPSKELVIQIFEVFERYSANTDLKMVCFYGGVGATAQIKKFEEGCDILVATPGRFKDIYYKGHVPTKQLKFLVLDEADRMMDLGFMPQLRHILEVIPTKRQNLLFSATFPNIVKQLSEEFLEHPTRVEVEGSHKTVDTVDQYKVHLKNQLSKIRFLEHLLEDESFARVLVFAGSKEVATQLSKFINRANIGEVRVLHANKSQNARIEAFKAFNAGELRVLVTTDVSARGIDIPNVTHVVHFDVPHSHETYVHRTGRTGRAKQEGVSILFHTITETFYMKKLADAGVHLKEWESEFKPNEDYLPGEEQTIARSVDTQKRLENPDFQGAFHDRKKSKKKRVFPPKKK